MTGVEEGCMHTGRRKQGAALMQCCKCACRNRIRVGKSAVGEQGYSDHPMITVLKRFSIFWVCLLVCVLSGSENGRCVASEYFTEPDIELTTENTANILSEYSFWQHFIYCARARVSPTGTYRMNPQLQQH